MNRVSLGERELELLRFISEHAPISVGQVSEQWGEPRGLTRSTIQVMMERIHRKGYLTRHKEKDRRGYCYRPRVPESDVLRGIVARFIQKTLGGSVTPFVAYLSETKDVTPEEVAALRRLVEELDERQEEKP